MSVIVGKPCTLDSFKKSCKSLRYIENKKADIFSPCLTPFSQ